VSSLHINSFSEAFLEAPFIETIGDAELRPSPIAGKGLFSLRPRADGEILCVMDGQEVDPRHHPRVMEQLEWNALSPTRLLVRPLRTSYGYINHSIEPNVMVDEAGFTLRTCRAIAVGEEFTMDYFAQPVPEAYLKSAEALRLKGATSSKP
jgi:uncharacterized protein